MARSTGQDRSTTKNTVKKSQVEKSLMQKKSSGSKKPKSKTDLGLSEDLIKSIFTLMVKSRVLEERLIKIYKSGEAYFWIGAPGEEAFGVPLGLLVNKGRGIQHDYLHMHYRATPTLVAMGMSMIDSVRLIMNRSTDPCTGGRNFSNHYCFPEWNVTPVTSPIEVQYTCAIGTAWVQKREKAKGISIITGGDAGTAEGDFASCLVWASRKGNELPMLITVQNNKWGISTDFDSQHGEKNIADRGKAFGMRTAVINGNDPVESYLSLQAEIEYVKKNRKPVLLEARVSRLFGHSSASGANKTSEEIDCVYEFQDKVLKAGIMKEAEVKEMWTMFEAEARQAQEQVRLEPTPKSDTIWNHVYYNNENADWRKF
jgi:2-oxoisovalerate dehydrogenase E1 component alpha subunit